MNKAEAKLKVDDILTQVKLECYRIIDSTSKDINPLRLIKELVQSIKLTKKTQGIGKILVEQTLFEIEDNVALPLFSEDIPYDEN